MKKFLTLSSLCFALFSCTGQYECDCTDSNFGNTSNSNSQEQAEAMKWKMSPRSYAKEKCTEVDCDIRKAD